MARGFVSTCGGGFARRGAVYEDETMRFPITKLILAAALGLAISVALPLAAQTPEDLYYGPMETRLAGGADLEGVMDSIDASLTDLIPVPAPPAFPLCGVIPVGGFPNATSLGFYYLTEILPPGIGTTDPLCGAWLGCFLDNVAGTVHDNATLVIDRQCNVERTLVVPNRFVLAGVGMDGAGRLVFDLPDTVRALRFLPVAPPALVDIRHSEIRDLAIGSAVCCGQSGIDLSGSTLVDVDNVRVSGFAIGINGNFSYANTIEGSNLSNNIIGIRQGFDTTTWQMRENAISFSRFTGVGFHQSTRGAVLSGGVIEGNLQSGVELRGTGNIVQNTWFEGNGIVNGLVAIRIPAPAVNAKVLTSLFSNNDILDASASTLRCYNTAVGPLIADNCP